jgi:uncharacterized membrane protein
VDIGTTLAHDYNVFVIGDLAAAAIRPNDVQAIRKKVEGGAGIAMLGGFQSFEAGGWGFGTPASPPV